MVAPVAIAVVSWNTREMLRACLLSAEAEVDAGRAQVWVVDNGSDDGTLEMLSADFAWAQTIASPVNLGFGAAVNLVAERTDSAWIAAANADVELAPGALVRLLEAGARDPAAGVVAPRLVLPSGATQHSVYSFPTVAFSLAFNLGLAGMTARLADRFALEGRWDPTRGRRVDWAIGACLLIRRTAWDTIGGFDSGQWMYAEDLDLSWRLARAGWHTRFEPAAIVRHHGAAATSQLWGQRRQEQWLRSTYAWMLRRRGPLVTRTVALVNTLGAGGRTIWLTGPALVRGGEQLARWRSMLRWTRLHLGNLVSSRKRLESHR